MAEYDNTNTGAIFRNEKKAEDKHPDYTGSLDVNGVPHYLDGWIRHKKDGSGSFLSVRIKPKGQSQPSRQQSTPKQQQSDDSDIPF